MHGHYSRKSLAEIVAEQVVVLVLEHTRLARKIVHNFRECGFETRFVRAALRRRNIVDVGENAFRIRVRILKRKFHGNVVFTARNDYRFGKERIFGLVKILYEVYESALIAIFAGKIAVAVRDALVRQNYARALIEERKLLKTTGNDFYIEIDGFENTLVRLETHERAVLVRLFACVDKVIFDKSALYVAALFESLRLEFHSICRTVFVHFDGKPFRQCVRDRRAYAVKSARMCVVLVVELSACVQLRKDNLYARHSELRMHVYGYTSAVVLHGSGTVRINRNIYRLTEAVCNLVH